MELQVTQSVGILVVCYKHFLLDYEQRQDMWSSLF
jgi:hypothetical protein